jgi:hypothetical protein
MVVAAGGLCCDAEAVIELSARRVDDKQRRAGTFLRCAARLRGGCTSRKESQGLCAYSKFEASNRARDCPQAWSTVRRPWTPGASSRRRRTAALF